MNVIRDTNGVPQDGWRFPGVNGFVVSTHNYSLLYHLVKQHFEANGQSAPSPQEVIDYQCAHLVVPCYDSGTHEPLINRFTQGLPPDPRTCCGK